MKSRVDIETSIVSYLTALPSRDIVQAAHQQITRDWWAVHQQFELFTSQVVLDEAMQRHPDAAARRLRESGREVVSFAPRHLSTDALRQAHDNMAAQQGDRADHGLRKASG
jgi:hypothetical protein